MPLCVLPLLSFLSWNPKTSPGNEKGTKYGPPTDQIDADVIIKFKDNESNAFGFQLRDDDNSLVHHGMLDLSKDAFNNDWKITINYSIETGKKTA